MKCSLETVNYVHDTECRGPSITTFTAIDDWKDFLREIFDHMTDDWKNKALIRASIFL